MRISDWSSDVCSSDLYECQRAILVGHNAHFDLNFLNAAVARVAHKRNPFHPFSVFDTVTLAGVAYGQTVLARAVQAAGLEWNSDEAHSAVYDAERRSEEHTSELQSLMRISYAVFCLKKKKHNNTSNRK